LNEEDTYISSNVQVGGNVQASSFSTNIEINATTTTFDAVKWREHPTVLIGDPAVGVTGNAWSKGLTTIMSWGSNYEFPPAAMTSDQTFFDSAYYYFTSGYLAQAKSFITSYEPWRAFNKAAGWSLNAWHNNSGGGKHHCC